MHTKYITQYTQLTNARSNIIIYNNNNNNTKNNNNILILRVRATVMDRFRDGSARSGESETTATAPEPARKKTHLTHRRFPFKRRRGCTHARRW